MTPNLSEVRINAMLDNLAKILKIFQHIRNEDSYKAYHLQDYKLQELIDELEEKYKEKP